MKRCIISGLTILLSFLFIVTACSFDDSDDNKDKEEDNGDNGSDNYDDDECAGNSPPELLSVAAIVNGQQEDWPVVVGDADQLELAFEYKDMDCNLEGGALDLIAEGIESCYSSNDWNLVDIGCSSAQIGEPYKLPFLPGYFEPDDAPFKIEIFDACGAYSNALIVEISFQN